MAHSQSQSRLQFFPLWLSLGIALMCAVVFLSVTANPPKVADFEFNDKIGHFLAYATLMGWFGQIFTARRQLAVLAVGFAALGVSLEYVQGMGHHRHFEYADMAANSIGVILGLLLTTTVFKGSLQWFERRFVAT